MDAPSPRQTSVRSAGLLLVPSVELHERIDRALGGAHHAGHHHEETGTGLLGMLEHGVHVGLRLTRPLTRALDDPPSRLDGHPSSG